MRRKLLLAGTFFGTMALSGPAFAQETIDAATVQLNLNVIYFMLAIVLVFFMQAGFAMLETGLTRSKNAANIMMKNMADMSFGFLAYFLVGFGFMYGASAGGLIGTDTFALAAGSYTDGLSAPVATDSIPIAADFMYQVVFAATAATIVSGAVAGRMKFSGYVILSIAMTAFIYPVVGHWKWGGGWLDALGFYDFAGSTIVHLTGGVAALTAAAILGPRLGKFGKDGKARALPGHAAPLTVLGTFILFFGWFGFNGGSVLAADGPVVANVLLTTALAGAAGGCAAMLFTWFRYAKPDMSMTCNGVLAGLVGITAGADQVGPFAAIGVGLVAGVVVALSVAFIDRIKIDDAVGAFSVHGACGILGTWWVGIFANTGAEGLTGLWHGGGVALLIDQIIGTVAVAAFVAVATAAVVLLLKATGHLRVSEEEEFEGLDIHEHGMYGYPELALGPQAYPGGPATAVSGEVVSRDPSGSSREKVAG
ncbi:MAG: ammonium transporter [Egibacteraceae bacterium]